VSVVEPGVATVDDAALNVSVGGPTTATVTDCVADPPAPVHVSANVAVAFNAPVDSLPDVALPPDQPCVALHAVALVLFQVSVASDP
jgi:hypothetical protein